MVKELLAHIKLSSHLPRLLFLDPILLLVTVFLSHFISVPLNPHLWPTEFNWHCLDELRERLLTNVCTTYLLPGGKWLLPWCLLTAKSSARKARPQEALPHKCWTIGGSSQMQVTMATGLLVSTVAIHPELFLIFWLSFFLFLPPRCSLGLVLSIQSYLLSTLSCLNLCLDHYPLEVKTKQNNNNNQKTFSAWDWERHYSMDIKISI